MGFHRGMGRRGEEDWMIEQKALSLDLEIEEIETREKAGGTCTSSTTSRHCTCMCIYPTTLTADLT
jgi:hypothetical protein